eukprot:Nk52_evm1s1335 gene=Nk52_evmTU1s1335
MDKLSQIKCEYCTICKRGEVTTDGVRRRRFKCKSCGSRSANVRGYTAGHMIPDERPQELTGLTTVEELSIAILAPQVFCYTNLNGFQTFYNGHTIVFPKDSSELWEEVNVLPRRNVPVIKLKRVSDENGEVVNFPVRREKIYRALRWLKRNNPYYRHIRIDENVFPDDNAAIEVAAVVG